MQRVRPRVLFVLYLSFIGCASPTKPVRISPESTPPSSDAALSAAPPPGVQPQVVAGESHTCFLTRAGVVFCWGRNYNGQLGSSASPNDSTSTPVHVDIANVKQLASGPNHVCAILSSGEVSCWGQDEAGETGETTPQHSSTRSPRHVPGVTGATALGLGSTHSCAIVTDGAVICWGDNQFGELGRKDRGPDRFLSPRRVPLPVRATDIAAGRNHTCVLDEKGDVYCWGATNQGQLCRHPDDGEAPGKVTDFGSAASAVAVAASDGLTCIVRKEGSVACCGHSSYFEDVNNLGLERERRIRALSLAEDHLCVRLKAGGLSCAGAGLRVAESFRPPGSPRDASSLVDVPALPSPILGFAAGMGWTCALAADNRLRCWGQNDSGQTGDRATMGGVTTSVHLIDLPPQIPPTSP